MIKYLSDILWAALFAVVNRKFRLAEADAEKAEDKRLHDQRDRLMTYVEAHGQEMAMNAVIGEFMLAHGRENVEVINAPFGTELRINVVDPENPEVSLGQKVIQLRHG